jgi:hypothetical protein
MRITAIFFFYLMLLMTPFSDLLGDSGKPTQGRRQKVIDFEGELVEGVNRKSLDSLSQISESKKRISKTHLYRKRQSFRSEMNETLREMRHSP